MENIGCSHNKEDTEFYYQQSSGSEFSDSSTEDYRSDNKILYKEHKMGKRNRNLFKFDGVKNNKAEVLKIDRNDPELRQFLDNCGIDIDNEHDRKPKKIFRLAHLTPLYTEDSPPANGNIIGGHYGFASEFQLQEKYSSNTFDFLDGVVKNYAQFLKEHPGEKYPSITELMIRSDQKLSKEESERVRYYDEQYLKIRPKDDHYLQLEGKSRDEIDENALDKSTTKMDQRTAEVIKKRKIARMKRQAEKCIGYYVPYGSSGGSTGLGCTMYTSNEEKKDVRKGPLSQDEVNQARKTGILDMCHRSLVEVPSRIWSIDAICDADRKAFSEGFEVPLHPRFWWKFKSLVCLNLSYNSLTTFCPQGTALKSLEELRVTNNILDELPDDIGNLKLLKKLDLETNCLKQLPDNFCLLECLTELNLRRNFIIKLPNDTGKLTNLSKADFSLNKLHTLPKSFGYLKNLIDLNLSFNKISALPETMNELKSLEKIDLSYNHLTVLPKMTNMTKLTLVNIISNRLRQFPNFSGCRMLNELHLDANNIVKVITSNLKGCPLVQFTIPNNRVEAIPDDICTIETLSSLDFSNNRLLWLPWSLARLKKLNVLRIDDNAISNVDQATLEAGSEKILSALTEKLIRYEGDDLHSEKNKNKKTLSESIEVLYNGNTNNLVDGDTYKKNNFENIAITHRLVIKNRGLTVLPDEIIKVAKEAHVKHVNLSQNNFSYVPVGLKSLLPYLRELIIKENNLKTIPDFIGRMCNLQVLDLSYNCLDSLPLSITMTNLKKLTCRGNCFTSIPKTVYSILELQHLDFSKNKIADIEVDGLRNLKNLLHLNYNDNLVKKVPPELGNLTNLRTLNLFNNYFKKPGFSILIKDTPELLRYIKQMKEDSIM